MCVLRGWIWNRMFYRHIFSVLSWHAWRQQIRTESFLNNFHSSSPCCHRDEEVLCGRCLVWDSGRGATFTVRSVLLIIVKMSCRITNWARIERLDSADESRCYRSQKLPMVSVRKKNVYANFIHRTRCTLIHSDTHTCTCMRIRTRTHRHHKYIRNSSDFHSSFGGSGPTNGRQFPLHTNISGDVVVRSRTHPAQANGKLELDLMHDAWTPYDWINDSSAVAISQSL